MSIDVLFSSKGRREVVITLLSWCAFILWSNNVSWFARYSGLLRVSFLIVGDGFYIWKLKYGHDGRVLYRRTVFYINTELMVCGQWRREIHVSKAGLLFQLGHVCRLFFLNWQERERLKNLWVRFYRLQRGLEGGVLWRLEYVNVIQYTWVIWQSLHQNKEFNAVYEMEYGLVFSVAKVLSVYKSVHISFCSCIIILRRARSIRTNMTIVVVAVDVQKYMEV